MKARSQRSRRVLVVFNPSAGMGRTGMDLATIVPRLERKASRKGISLDISVLRTSGRGDCHDAAMDAASSGIDILAACGGDGTVMEAAAGISGSGTSLGIVPIGSGNDTVFSISGHRDIDRCLEDIVTGNVRSLDMGSMNGELFLNVVGIGLDAEVNHLVSRNRRMVLRYGPLLTYTVSALRVISSFRPYEVEMSLDDGMSRRREVGMFTVGNGSTCGGGFRLTPRARMDDGLLDVSICRHIGRVRSVLNIWSAMKGRHLGRDGTTYRQVGRINVRGIDRELPYHIDGEAGFADELQIEVVPSCLRTVHPLVQE